MLTVNVEDVNEPASVDITTIIDTISEDTDLTSGLTVAILSITDDAVQSASITLAGTHSQWFEISPQGELRLIPGTVLDAATMPSLDVVVLISDINATPALTQNIALTIAVTSVLDPPEPTEPVVEPVLPIDDVIVTEERLPMPVTVAVTATPPPLMAPSMDAETLTDPLTPAEGVDREPDVDKAVADSSDANVNDTLATQVNNPIWTMRSISRFEHRSIDWNSVVDSEFVGLQDNALSELDFRY